jgi:hypothetical protein
MEKTELLCLYHETEILFHEMLKLTNNWKE